MLALDGVWVPVGSDHVLAKSMKDPASENESPSSRDSAAGFTKAAPASSWAACSEPHMERSRGLTLGTA